MNRRLFLFLCVYAVISLRGAVWHVSTTGSDDRSGLSWRHSFRSVGHALEVASPGDEIWIAAGCYEPAVSSGVIMPSGSFRLTSRSVVSSTVTAMGLSRNGSMRGRPSCVCHPV